MVLLIISFVALAFVIAGTVRGNLYLRVAGGLLGLAVVLVILLPLALHC